jgi:glutathione peroxidase
MTKLNAHSFSFLDMGGKKINLSDYKGKILLIVNTASKCGFTGQYKDMQSLYEKYKDQGLVVLAVPSGNFASQEFTNPSEIKEFTKENYQITFPLTEICNVKGPDAHPFYQWANEQAGFIGSPKWNFHKYLIDQNGDLVKWYSSTTAPESKKIIDKIEELIAQNE